MKTWAERMTRPDFLRRRREGSSFSTASCSDRDGGPKPKVKIEKKSERLLIGGKIKASVIGVLVGESRSLS